MCKLQRRPSSKWQTMSTENWENTLLLSAPNRQLMHNFISAVDTTTYDRTDESRMYSLWRPALISLCNCTTYSSRAWQVAICTLPAVAVSCVFPTRLMSGPCVSYSTEAIRGSGEIIMGLMRHHTEYQVLFHVSSALFTFLVQPLVGSNLFRSGSSLKHLHIPCLRRSSLVVSREDPYHFRRCCGPRTGICGKRWDAPVPWCGKFIQGL